MSDNGRLSLDNFEELYEKFGPMVLRRCRWLLRDEDKALDAMQDVFVRILERREKISEVCSSLFYTVATSVCLNRIRSDRVRHSPQIDHLLEEIADHGRAHHEEVIDAAQLLDCVFSDAKEDTRRMAVLHYVDGLTLEETARSMTMSVSGVRKRLSTLRTNALRCVGD